MTEVIEAFDDRGQEERQAFADGARVAGEIDDQGRPRVPAVARLRMPWAPWQMTGRA